MRCGLPGVIDILVVVYYLPQDHQSPGINLQLLRSWKVRICLCCVPENYGPFRLNSLAFSTRFRESPTYCPFLYITCPDTSGMVYVRGRAPYSRFSTSFASATLHPSNFWPDISVLRLDSILEAKTYSSSTDTLSHWRINRRARVDGHLPARTWPFAAEKCLAGARGAKSRYLLCQYRHQYRKE